MALGKEEQKSYGFISFFKKTKLLEFTVFIKK